MMEAVETRPRAGLLQRLVLIALLLGPLTGLLYGATRGQEPAIFIQAAAVIGFVAYLLSFVDLAIGLGILIACIGFSPELSVGGLHSLRLEDFLVPGLLLAWAARAGHWRAPLEPSPLHGPAFLYLLAALSSTLLGLAADTTSVGSAAVVMGKYVEYYAIYLLVLNNVRTREEFKALTVFALLTAAASALLNSFPLLDAAPRVHGPQGETANIYGGYIVLHLAMLVGFYLRAEAMGGRLVSAAGLVLLTVCLLSTYSRTSFAAAVLACVAFGVLKERRLLAVLAMVIVLLPIVAPESVWSRLSTIGGVAVGPDPASWTARLSAWETALSRLMVQGPLLGFGLGSVRRGDIDSEYVRTAVDMGLAGLLVFGWFLWRMFRQTWRVHGLLGERGFHKAFAAGFLIALLAQYIHAIAATSFSAIRPMETLMVLAGLAGAQANHLEEWGLVPAPKRPPAEPVLLIVPPEASGNRH